jgi:hypothetical protein
MNQMNMLASLLLGILLVYSNPSMIVIHVGIGLKEIKYKNAIAVGVSKIFPDASSDIQNLVKSGMILVSIGGESD